MTMFALVANIVSSSRGNSTDLSTVDDYEIMKPFRPALVPAEVHQWLEAVMYQEKRVHAGGLSRPTGIRG